MERSFKELQQVLEKGEEAVLVTVLASSGSAPRGAGARMLVKRDGQIQGTIGGGGVEYRAVQIALEAMRERVSYIKGFTLTKDQVSDMGMVCGGDVTVYFQYISPDDSVTRGVCAQVLEAFRRDEDTWLLLDISEETCWRMGICGREGWEDTPFAGMLERMLEKDEGVFSCRARQYQVEGRMLYIEPLVQAGAVYIFGGGHVARELVPVLAHVGFRCVVMDDREEFCSPQRFPMACRTVVGDMERIADHLTICEKDYVCVMTRGHSTDYLVQRQVLACRPRYVGVIGSRNKVAMVTERLLEDGFSREEIAACHMPIGTRICAETPAEIAISIAGELIAVRAGCGAA